MCSVLCYIGIYFYWISKNAYRGTCRGRSANMAKSESGRKTKQNWEELNLDINCIFPHFFKF